MDISYLSHLFTVGLGIQGGFRQKNRMLFRCNTQFVVESVVPDLLHVVPVGDDSVLDGVLQRENTTLRLGFISDVRVLLSHTNHHSLMTGTTNDGREHGARSIVSSETGLAHTRTIIHDQSSYFSVTHFQKI